MAYKVIELDKFKDLVDENTTIVFDYDQIAYISATVVEEKFIDVKHIASGRVKRFKNKSEFCGRKKKRIEGWLGDQNVMREAEGKEPWTREDFEIIPVQVAPDVSHAIQAAKLNMEAVRRHLGIDKYFGVIGADGPTFRHILSLPQKYKSNRQNTARPVLLPETREYLVKYQNAEVVNSLEADDKLCQYGYESYLHYQKTGKLKYIVASFDKDNNHTPMIYFNTYRENGKFKHPLPIHIDNGLGELWMSDGEVKGYGLLWLGVQMLIGDSSDHIRPYQDFGIDYGDAACYKTLATADSIPDLLSRIYCQYQEWFPGGVEYQDSEGNLVKLTNLEWAEIIFQLVYMKRVDNDKTTFTKLLKKFKVEI